MASNRFRDVEDLRDAIDLGLDIEFDLFGVRYYIGAPMGILILSWNSGKDEVEFHNIDELLRFKIEGKPIKELWQDIEIYSM